MASASNSVDKSVPSNPRYFVFKVKAKKGRTRFQHVHDVTDLQKAHYKRKWRKFFSTIGSYMLYQSVRNESAWLCCYKKDAKESQRARIVACFPEDEFALVFRVQADRYVTETDEVYFMKDKVGEAKCFASLREKIPTKNNHQAVVSHDGLECDICTYE